MRLGGRSVADYVRLPVDEARAALAALDFPERERPVADRLRHEIVSRLGFLESVGLGYLSLDRPTTTLSGGEAQRLRLAGQIGARMQGILYVLDEPSVGLHAARQRAAAGDPEGDPRPRQHGGGGRARRGDDPRRRLRGGPRRGRGRARRPADVPGTARPARRQPDRPLHARRAADPGARPRRRPAARPPAHPGRHRAQPAGHRRGHPPRRPHRGHRGERLRQVHPGGGHPPPRAGAAPARRRRRARQTPRARGRGRRSTR